MLTRRNLTVLMLTFRAVVGLVAAVCLFKAGHDMRGQGSGIPWEYGLIAYGLGFLALLFAIPNDLVLSEPGPVSEHRPDD